MGGNADGLAGLNSGAGSLPWDRYGNWPRARARLALAILAVFLVLAAWSPGMPEGPKDVPDLNPPASDISAPAKPGVAAAEADNKDNDLRLYRLIIERVKRGDNYYQAATELQRANNYPVAPGLTVRLPTLAVFSALLGPKGVAVVAALLLAAVLFSNFKRLKAEPGGEQFALFGPVLMFVGLSTAIQVQFNVLHEVWLAELMALSFGLHRPDKGQWRASWLAAAAALAVREMALPFVLLMAANALYRRRWHEGAAWVALTVIFAAALTLHLHTAESYLRPGDPVSPPWLVLGGLQGWLYKIIHSSSLNLLPMVLAGPAVILAVFGWTGWRSAMGSFAAMLVLGYGLAFMIAGRDNNFYWGVIITPILFMGLAMVPFSARALWQRAAVGVAAHG